MNQMTRAYIGVLLVWVVACMNSGCSVVEQTLTSTPRPPTVVLATTTPLINSAQTIVPSFAHYTPSGNFNVDLEFDYPDNWTLTEEMRGEFIVISLGDPRSLSGPTRTPGDLHPVPNDYGNVEIWVSTAKPGQSLDGLLASHKESYSNTFYVKALNSYQIQIDGHDAYVFEDQIDFPEVYASLMFERNIFFAVEDRIYQIIFLVAEKDRDGIFEQGYESFFESLEIVP